MFSGIVTALITPFDDIDSKKIDYASLDQILEAQSRSGIQSILIGGSTGEGLSLSSAEYLQLLKHVIKHVDGKIKIIASIPGLETSIAENLIHQVCELQVNGLMLTAPIYYKPCQEGIEKYFTKLAKISQLPVMLYNIPGRAAVNIERQTIINLTKVPNITAIKDASAKVELPLLLSDKIDFLTGDDINYPAYRSQGAVGCVSVISNLLPKQTLKIHQNLERSDYLAAIDSHKKLLSFYKMLEYSTNPIVIKYLMSKVGLSQNYLRLPLCPLSNTKINKVNEILLQNKNILQNEGY